MNFFAKKKIKMVFFDIDGTLVSTKTGAVPDSALMAIKHIQKKGIRIIVATGRSINVIDKVKHINFDGFITFNGSYCVAADGRVLSKTTIDASNVKSLLDWSFANNSKFTLMNEKDVLVYDIKKELVDMYSHSNLPASAWIDFLDVRLPEVLQAHIFIAPELERAFMEKVMPDCVLTRCSPFFADVNPVGVNKHIGIMMFCEKFGIDVSETMAFGDGGNDVSMLKHAGIGVAMGNASADVTAIADYVTTDVDDNGISKALEYFDKFFIL